jgi:hypothetical protein
VFALYYVPSLNAQQTGGVSWKISTTAYQLPKNNTNMNNSNSNISKNNDTTSNTQSNDGVSIFFVIGMAICGGVLLVVFIFTVYYFGYKRMNCSDLFSWNRDRPL